MTYNIKVWLISMILTASVISFDLSSRLQLEESTERKDNATDALILMNQKKVSDKTLSDTLALYAKYDQKKIVKTKPKVKPNKKRKKKAGMSELEQQNQQGRLDKLYVGNMRFQLKGIFSDNNRFAVLIRENLDSNKIDEISVIKNETVGSYKVTLITEHQVLFELGDKNVQLSIF